MARRLDDADLLEMLAADSDFSDRDDSDVQVESQDSESEATDSDKDEQDPSSDSDSEDNSGQAPPQRRRKPPHTDGGSGNWNETIPPSDIPIYHGPSGPSVMLQYDSPELEFLMSQIGNDFFIELAENTNLYAVYKSPPAHPNAADRLATSDKCWYPTKASEIKAYMGINILMGLSQLPEGRDYWSTDSALHNNYVAQRFSRNRFEKLSRYLHITDPFTADANDKLDKVRPLLNKLAEGFYNSYTPGPCIAIDEAMIQFDGRLGWKQYMPKKPIKWGIKLWCLCDSTTGYCSVFDVYTGKDTERSGHGLAYDVVMRLSDKFLGTDRHIYADNFFSSVRLVQQLLDKNMYYCGTVRKNSKGLPKKVITAKLKRGEKKQMVNEDGIVVCKWRDKRDVCMISSNSDSGDTEKRRRNKDEIISVPNMVVKYNQYMGGVDHNDQSRAYYNVGRSGKKWWKFILWGLFNIAVVNAHILHSLSRMPLPSDKRKYSLKNFKLALVHQLVDNFSSRKRSISGTTIGMQVVNVVQRDILPGHSLVQLEGRKKACCACSMTARRTSSGRCVETSYACSLCQVPLCRKGACFQEFHGLLGNEG